MIAAATQGGVPTLLNGETLIGLSKAAKMIPAHTGDGHTQSSTIFRWITKGAKDPVGNVVKLEAVRLGTRWLTSAEALARFASALAGNIAEPPAAIPIPPPTRLAQAATSELDARLGVRRK